MKVVFRVFTTLCAILIISSEARADPSPNPLEALCVRGNDPVGETSPWISEFQRQLRARFVAYKIYENFRAGRESDLLCEEWRGLRELIAPKDSRELAAVNAMRESTSRLCGTLYGVGAVSPGSTADIDAAGSTFDATADALDVSVSAEEVNALQALYLSYEHTTYWTATQGRDSFSVLRRELGRFCATGTNWYWATIVSQFATLNMHGIARLYAEWLLNSSSEIGEVKGYPSEPILQPFISATDTCPVGSWWSMPGLSLVDPSVDQSDRRRYECLTGQTPTPASRGSLAWDAGEMSDASVAEISVDTPGSHILSFAVTVSDAWRSAADLVYWRVPASRSEGPEDPYSLRQAVILATASGQHSGMLTNLYQRLDVAIAAAEQRMLQPACAMVDRPAWIFDGDRRRSYVNCIVPPIPSTSDGDPCPPGHLRLEGGCCHHAS
ncbi:MAG: hypothetical protein U0324_24610, partial [Polyangiales bacterium]